MDTKTKISTARYIAMQKAPYFAHALFKTQFRKVPLGTLPSGGAGTMAMTDKGVVLYEEKCVERWSEKQLAGVIIHELNHLIRHHVKRRGNRDPAKWNANADREINDDLQAMGLSLPDVPCVPEQIRQPRGLSAEEYYDADKSDEQQGGGPGQGSKPASGQCPGSGQCGSCSGSDELEDPEHEHGQTDRDDVEMDAMRDQVAQDVQQHAKKGRGNVPAGLERWANAQLAPPTIPWETRLARVVRNAVAHRPGAVDYTLSKMSRRQPGIEFACGEFGDGLLAPILPGLIEPVPNVGVGIDTSGSMGSDELLKAVEESAGILKATGGEIQFIACDAAVHAAVQVNSVKELVKHMKGGGGTDFAPIFDQIDRMQPKPEVFVMITDGDGPAPLHPPKGVQIIWLLVGPYRRKPYAGKYGGPDVTYGTFIEVDS